MKPKPIKNISKGISLKDSILLKNSIIELLIFKQLAIENYSDKLHQLSANNVMLTLVNLFQEKSFSLVIMLLKIISIAINLFTTINILVQFIEPLLIRSFT